MAQIYDTNSANQYQVPATPVKGGVTVNSTEIGQEISPAPAYNAKQDIVIDDGDVFNRPHPMLPQGYPLHDVKTHLICQDNMNMNIQTLMDQFRQMKADLQAARDSQAQTERSLQKEKAEKESYMRQAEAYQAALKEAQDDLASVRIDLVATEARLQLAIKQLADTIQRLSDTKNELRLRTRERDELANKLADTVRELEFYRLRSAELQAALEIANAGENAANDRNTRLTALLYQIEAAKAAIERIKDSVENDNRRLRLDVEEVRRDRGDAKREAVIIQLRLELVNLNIMTKKLTDEKNVALAQIDNQRAEIGSLNQTIRTQQGVIEEEQRVKDAYLEIWGDYERRVQRLPVPYRKIEKTKVGCSCKNRFPNREISIFSSPAEGELAGLQKYLEQLRNTPSPVDDEDAEGKPTETPTTAGPSSVADKDAETDTDRVPVIPPPSEPQVSIPKGETGVPTEGEAEPEKAAENEIKTSEHNDPPLVSHQ